jgi:hypothetical protein
MKPTYEELEAQAAAYRQTLIDIKKLGPYIKVPLDLARPEELADEALLSTAGQSLLARLETLEKALDEACKCISWNHMGCPLTRLNDEESDKCGNPCDKKGHDCWKDYFIHKVGDSQ